MAAQSDDSFVEVILFDRQLPLQIPRQPTCEELWRNIARKELGIKPSTLELFGIYVLLLLSRIFKRVKMHHDSSERIVRNA